ncbi:MAG: helix-turn-helix domain-containing protein [Azospirillaceae bacterium]|nr:helix-turn-helix domain-containing protein [Azospirillaceae bacterium]
MDAVTEIDRYILDTLMRDLVGHDHRPSAYLVYLALVADAAGGRVMLSHAEMAERTGLSKRAVQDALRHLAGRGLARISRTRTTEAATVEPLFPWRDRRG